MRLRDYEYCAMQIAFRYQQCNKGESKFARNMLNMIKEMAIEQSEIIERCIWEHSQCRQLMKDAVKEEFNKQYRYNWRLLNQMYHSYSMEQEDYYQYLMETKKEYYLSFIMPDYVYNILNGEKIQEPSQQPIAPADNHVQIIEDIAHLATNKPTLQDENVLTLLTTRSYNIPRIRAKYVEYYNTHISRLSQPEIMLPYQQQTHNASIINYPAPKV